MTDTKEAMPGSLTPQDFERIHRLIYGLTDDFSITVARAFERMENRLSDLEGHLRARLADIAERMEKANLTANP